MFYGEKFTCPCCRLLTLDAPAEDEVCPECGWEDDGQGDGDADVVRGGPNGALSLSLAREAYAEALREAPNRHESISEGGVGLWWAEALRQGAAFGVPVPDFDLDVGPGRRRGPSGD